VNDAVDWLRANGQTLLLGLGGVAVFLLPLIYGGDRDDR
jgi:hypothetical protein